MRHRALFSLCLATLLLPWGDFTNGNLAKNEVEAQSRRRRQQQPQTHQAGFFVVGTDVVFDDFGFPSQVSGVLLSGNGRRVGRYEETVQPVFDPEFGFIGTVGVSTFTFTNWSGRRVLGTVVVENSSMFQGFGFDDSVWLIESTGVVVDGTGLFRNAVGGVSNHFGIMFDDFFVLDAELTVTFSRRFNGRRFGFRRVADLPVDPGDDGGGDIGGGGGDSGGGGGLQ